MSLEEALAANTAALTANTQVQEAILAKIGGNTDVSPSEEPDAPEEETKASDADAKKKAAAAKRKATAAKKKALAAIEVRLGIDVVEVRKLAREFGENDGGDSDERERLKGLMASAFDHLGSKKLSDLDDEDRVKFAHYLDHWIVDSKAKLDFEKLDETVASAIEEADDGGNDEDDDMLG